MSNELLTPAQHIRLELVKLVAQRISVLDAPTVVDKASKLELYILGNDEKQKPAGKPAKDRKA